jgi:hypothetical protein
MILICEQTRWRVIMCFRSLSATDDGGEEEMRGSVQDPLCVYR